MMGRYRTRTPDMVDSVKDIQKRTSRLERTPQLTNSGVNYGSLTVRGGRIDIVRDTTNVEGYITMGSSTFVLGQEGIMMTMRRSMTVESIDGNHGKPSLDLRAVEGEIDGLRQPTIMFWDKSGSPIMADSGNARQGLSHPVLNSNWWGPNDYITSTSGTFAAIAQTFWYQYHPHLKIEGWTQNDVGTTSDLRVVDLNNSSAVLLTQTAIGSGVLYYSFDVDRLTTNDALNTNGAVEWLELQHRRASGAGNAKTLIAAMTGMDLS